MDRESFEKILQNPNMISGIHNYCDRWCERCPMTSRCSVFAITESENAEHPHSDMENEEFWNHLHEMFSLAIEMAKEWATKNGVDIEVRPTEDEIALREEIDSQTERHAIMTAARVYRMRTSEWFKANDTTFKQKAEQARQACELELPAIDPEAEIWELSDIVEVILWYHTLVLAKLHRAVHQVVERELTNMEDYSGDSDGSAKIALIGMDRSLTAWAVLRNHVPEQEDTILDFLVQLERLRRQTEQLFPKARAFVRPGLDERQ